MVDPKLLKIEVIPNNSVLVYKLNTEIKINE